MKRLLSERIATLEQVLHQHRRVLLAYSGGVDSTFLAVLGARVLKQDFLAVTIDHPGFPRKQLTAACQLAKTYAIPHKMILLAQLDVPGFRENPIERCYYCKKAMLELLLQEAHAGGFFSLMDGSNAEDAKDYRAGAKALAELGVESPLQTLLWSKEDIRQASRQMGLPTADQPSYACLASRIPPGSIITGEKLQQIEQMEELLHDLGFPECRARHHGDTLRLEIDAGAFPQIVQPDIRTQLLTCAQGLGFRWLTLDLEPYHTGRLNPIHPDKT
ncbi:MAG: ATP-dependent sacrificial sulfur transferase LarE [Lentisphaeria bacterium]